MESVLTASEKQNMVTSFLEIAVEQSAETARQFLQATSWQLEEAIQLYYVDKEDDGIRAAPNIPSLSDDNERAQVAEDDGIRPPLPVRREILYDSSDTHSAAVLSLREANPRVAFRNFDDESRQDGVWESSEGINSAEASRDSLASLYRPPFALMHRGSFEKAKTDASFQGKWLLANLQSTREFSSHMLNRDTWANEAVEQTISNNFIFWQAYDDTSEGRKICTFYKLNSVPVVLIIDPITGQNMRSWIGMVEPERLLEDLLPFLDNGPKDSSGIKCFKRPKGSSESSQISSSWKILESCSEEEELLLAISASMEGQEFGNSTLVDEDISGQHARDVEACSSRIPTYPSLSEEPKGESGLICRIGIRLPDGRRLQRKFLRTDSVKLLWTFCSSELGETSRPFQLTEAIPGASRTLDYESNLTFEESGLSNSMLLLTWK